MTAVDPSALHEFDVTVENVPTVLQLTYGDAARQGVFTDPLVPVPLRGHASRGVHGDTAVEDYLETGATSGASTSAASLVDALSAVDDAVAAVKIAAPEVTYTDLDAALASVNAAAAVLVAGAQ